MASCTCHVLCGTKRLRLERIVRPHRLILALKASQPSLIVFSWRQKARCARARDINCRCLWYVFRELQQLLAYAYSMNLEFISKLGAKECAVIGVMSNGDNRFVIERVSFYFHPFKTKESCVGYFHRRFLLQTLTNHPLPHFIVETDFR